MPRKKAEERNIRTLTKIAGGKSYAITIPIEMVRELGWEPKEQLFVRKWGKKVIVETVADRQKD